jgi:PAS domain-containing protein
MTRVLDGLPAGILVIRADRSIAYANHTFQSMWRIPEGLISAHNDYAVMHHVLGQVVDSAKFIAEAERLYSSNETSQDEVSFKDGRVFWRRSYPVMGDDGQMARIWMFADISEARQAIIENIYMSGDAVRAAQPEPEADAPPVEEDRISWLEKKKAELRNALKF